MVKWPWMGPCFSRTGCVDACEMSLKPSVHLQKVEDVQGICIWTQTCKLHVRGSPCEQGLRGTAAEILDCGQGPETSLTL